MSILVKSGGDANATAESTYQLAQFILSNKDRRMIVTSAPGKRPQDDVKLTQLLYKAVDSSLDRNFLEKVRTRFNDILVPLQIDTNILNPEFEYLERILLNFDKKNQSHVDELKFFGERCTQYVLTNVINKVAGTKKAITVTPWDLGVLLEEEMGVMKFSPASYRHIKTKFDDLKQDFVVVTAGFGGYDKFGNLRTLPFGGTDVSAAHIARAIDSELYENVKCVDGYANVDPRVVANSSLKNYLIHYDRVFFDEAIEASAGGADVIHADALDPCRAKGSRSEIPIRVCNLLKKNDWVNGGTTITDKEPSIYLAPIKFVTKKDNYCLVSITDDAMVSASNYAADVQSKLGARNISFEHIATSRNSFTLAIHKDSFNNDWKKISDYESEVLANFPSASVTIKDGISMISCVNKIYSLKKNGRDGQNIIGSLAKISTALAKEDIYIAFTSQAGERATTLGVETSKVKDGVLAIVKELYSEDQVLPDLPKVLGV